MGGGPFGPPPFFMPAHRSVAGEPHGFDMPETHQSSQHPRSRVGRGAIGIVRDGDRLLVIRRAAGVARPGCWCFPGGHVERGETSRRAVQRELLEELGIEVVTTRRLGAVRVLAGNYVLVVWCVEHLDGHIAPAPGEVAEVRWMLPDELRQIEREMPSNEHVLAMLGL